MAFDISSIFKDVPESGTGREQIEYIKLDLIDDDKKNFYSTDEIESLARNIATVGLLDPLRVRSHPATEGRYMVVSGHRRRLALKLLVQDDPAKWGEVACIHEQTAGSSTMQQLRLIFANADNRKMSPADVGKQAAQVEELLYKLKEEEGYEFPGRMRDYVAQIVGVSKSKLARLKVIRENLDDCWLSDFESNNLHEQTAYLLSQLPKYEQFFIYDYMESTKGSASSVSAAIVEAYKDRIGTMTGLTCPTEGIPCENIANKREATIRTGIYDFHACGKCCATCFKLTTCRYACPKLADQIARQKQETRERRLKEQAAQAEKDAPEIEEISNYWRRFGEAREKSGISVKDVCEAVGSGYCAADDKRYRESERGKSISTATRLPFGSVTRREMKRLSKLADLLGCSLDYLFCRTDVKEMATEAVSESGTDSAEPEFIAGAWYPVSVEPPVGKRLILIDSEWFVDTGKYIGCGEYTMDYGAPVAYWTLEPDPGAEPAAAPVPFGWQSGDPKVRGKYAAYIKLEGVGEPMLRELYWNGEWWAMFNERIVDDVTVQCWAERPEF